MQSGMGQLHVATSRPSTCIRGLPGEALHTGVEWAGRERGVLGRVDEIVTAACAARSEPSKAKQWAVQMACEVGSFPAPATRSDMPSRQARATCRTDNHLNSPWIGAQQHCRLVQSIGIVQPPSSPSPAASWANRQLAIPGGRQVPACLLPLPTCDPDLLVSVPAGQHTGACMEKKTVETVRRPVQRRVHDGAALAPAAAAAASQPAGAFWRTRAVASHCPRLLAVDRRAEPPHRPQLPARARSTTTQQQPWLRRSAAPRPSRCLAGCGEHAGWLGPHGGRRQRPHASPGRPQHPT